MKNKIILPAFFMATLFFACKKEKTEPSQPIVRTPYLEIRFGTSPGDSFDFAPYPNQLEMTVASMSIYPRLAFSVIDHNIEDENDSMWMQNADLNVYTSADTEKFSSRYTSLKYLDLSLKFLDIEDRFIKPCRFTAIAVPFNDTVEINPAGDRVIASYNSALSLLSRSDTLKVLP